MGNEQENLNGRGMASFDVLVQLSSRVSYESLVCSASKGLTQVSVHGHCNFEFNCVESPAEVPLVNIIPTYHSSEKENILEFIITFRKE